MRFATQPDWARLLSSTVCCNTSVFIRMLTPYLTHIGMIRGRATATLIALQDLELPALMTLGILDELIPNSIRMAAKWDLIVAVKHFHDRK